MDSVEMEDRVCAVCGKAFQEPKKTTGRKRKYCSQECERVVRRKYVAGYIKKRYREDPEFRERRIKDNSKYVIEKRNIKKEKAIRDAAIDLYNADTLEEIFEILNEKFNMKAKIYDKHARALRVPKESSK